jgi:LPXTG-motif cell wall-anchored protein
VVVEDHRISFRTTAVGVPHLVKVSYFPNWIAEGADGPWRAAPSLMVVVPTSEDVTLEFKNTWAETGGSILSIVGIALLIGVGVTGFRRKNAVASSDSAGSA